MNQYKRGLRNLAVILCAMLLVSLACTAVAGLTAIEAMPEHSVHTEIDTEMQAISIKDIKGCKRVTTFNIVKGEFLHNTQPVGAVYSHDIRDLGNKGTIQIFIENVDPMAQDFAAETAVVEHLKVESSYKFSIHIPQLLASSIVYANAQLLSTTGQIAGYDFIEFVNQPTVTEEHSSKTEPITLNLSMNAERRAMAPVPLRNGLLLTIHYEAPEGKTAVLDGDILIGEREAVDQAVQRNSMSLYLVQVLAIAAFAMLIFVAVLKRRMEFLPQILYVLGIAGLYTVAVIYDAPSRQPYLLMAFQSFFVSLVALGLGASVVEKLWVVPVRKVLCGLAAVLCLASFLVPGGGQALQYVVVLSGALLMGYETLTGGKRKRQLSGYAALLFLGFRLLGGGQMQLFAPVFDVSILLLAITTYTSLYEFVAIEKRNRFLTDHLEAEVERQTESLTHMIGEREDLLRYISHDLRKPIIGMRKLLPELSGADQVAARNAMTSMETKLDTVDNALGEISRYAKTNYHAEQSVVLSLDEVFQKVRSDFLADCDANGVRLKLKPSGMEVYAKPNALFSILSNLIFNALEHSGCDTIEITAQRYGKKQCRLIVSDNGKGAGAGEKLFVPYAGTGSQEANTGLGLYISKQFAISMGGDLLYLRDGEITTFSIILPIL